MRRSLIAVLGCALLATACSEPASQPEAVGPEFHGSRRHDDGGSVPAGCPSPDSVERLVKSLFPRGEGRNAVLSRYEHIVEKLGRRSPGQAALRTQALRLVDFILEKYNDGVLSGGFSLVTRQKTIALLNAVLCTVGLPQSFGPGSLNDDAAAAVIYPNSPDTTVVTGTRFSGVFVPAGSVSEPVLIQINRLPDSPWPLLTQLDQYPLFYEYTATPALPFQFDLTVGVCVVGTPPDPGRLRLAHNVPHSNPTGIEILPLAAAPFVDCEDAELGLGNGALGRWGQLARGGLSLLKGAIEVLAPRPLYATPFFGGAGLGGTVRTFSPFGAVDTLGIMTPDSPTEQARDFPVPPAVLLTTPTGRPMSGVSVVFEIVDGGGALTGGNTVSGAGGRAAAQAWSLQGEWLSVARATAAATPGSGFQGNGQLFYARGN